MKKKSKKKKVRKIKIKLKTSQKRRKKFVQQNNFKTNEPNIDIKKIKKQSTEKRIFNIKDYVVYPKHGVGRIISIGQAKIGDIEINFTK